MDTKSGMIFFKLTLRETEIISLVAKGGSAKEVALELGIAPCTVERHIENVRLKTRTRNRAHMVAVVIGHWLGNASDSVPVMARMTGWERLKQTQETELEREIWGEPAYSLPDI